MMRIRPLPTSRQRALVLLLSSFALSAMASPLLAAGNPLRVASAAQAEMTVSPPPGDSISSDKDAVPPATTDQANPAIAAPDNNDTADPARPNVDPNAPLPEVMYDLGKLPEPVRKMHDALVAACKSGDVEKLRPLLATGSDATQLTLGEMDEDPIKFLHDQAGDQGGQEILAIMEEILDAGYVHLDAGKPQELYVWPYFFAIPLDKLNAPQRVELFRIITAGDYEDMKSVGAYVFYRLGITPQGKWAFFVAGD
jgi:hypothetical protein